MPVVELSRSFADLLAEVAADVAAELDAVAAAAATTLPPDVPAVLIAAAGAEREALEWLGSHDLPGPRAGGPPVFVLGADTGRRAALQFMARGASDYFALPEDAEILRNTLERSLARHREVRDRLADAAGEGATLAGIVGESPALKAVLERAGRLVPYAHATALIVGERGTGKELLARAIHDSGPRRGAPFVTVSCAALPPLLMESELFGHDRGAFAEAHAAKPGLFEIADGGTIFLDEIGALPIELQAKLLRVLEEKEVRRVGGAKPRAVDVRVLAATSEPLADRVQKAEFREDLFYHLSAVTLALPPLRDRGEDVLWIARHLLGVLAHRHGLPVPPLETSARRLLLKHSWPGNVRELRNAIERALLLSPPGTLSSQELPVPPRAQGTAGTPRGAFLLPFPATLEEVMSAAARQALEAHGGNRTEAAKALGISRPRMRRLLRGRRPRAR